MNFAGLLIFCSLSLFFRYLEYYFHLLISGDILALLVLFSYFLYKKQIHPEIEKTSNLLLNNIGIMFVPIGVGLINYLDFITKFWQVTIFASIFTTIICLIMCFLVFKFLDE